MDRMKSFFIYFLLFAALYIVSSLLENGVISSMYGDIKGNAFNSDQLTINVSDAKATNVNGYMLFDITNNSDENVDSSYAKIEFVDEYNLNAITDYVTIKDLKPGESKEYKINFNGNKIDKYNISFVSELPDKSNIINILGWEIDKTNVFGLGLDLTNINGIDITKYFSLDGIKTLTTGGFEYAVDVLKDIPSWAYVIAALIVFWYI